LPDRIHEDAVRQNLYAPEIPDPDLIIRTGGQQRLSGFLTWQSVYSELFFVNTLWPAFTTQELDQILKEFERRQRNFGR
jgi:undecaprenyl diphosphate synthase